MSRRGFTLLEVGIAATLFAAALGVVAVAVARAQYAAAVSRNVSATAQEVEFLLDQVASRGGAELSGGVSQPPQPCDDDASRSCLTVQGRQVRVSWRVSQGLLWRSSAASGESSSLLLTADASSPLGFDIQRSVLVPLRPEGSLLRLVPSGTAYDGPVFLAASDGTVLTDASSRPVGGVVSDGAQVLLEVPSGACLTPGSCFLALSPDGSTRSGHVALTPRSVLAEVVVSPGELSEHHFEVQELRSFSVALEATAADGLRSSPSQPGSVCLWLVQNDDLTAGGACNSPDPSLVEFFILTPDPDRPHATAAFPAGREVQLRASRPDGSCPALPGALLPRSGAWIPVPEEASSGPCSDFVWGSPTVFRPSPDAAPVAFSDAFLMVEQGADMPFPVVGWSALLPEPLPSGGWLPASGSTGAVRTARPWSLPRECPEAADCSSLGTPGASTFSSGAFLSLPTAGPFGVASATLLSSAVLDLDVMVTSPSAASTSISLLSLPSGLGVQVYDDTELQAWQSNPVGEEPDPWQDVAVGENFPPSAYGSGSELSLRLSSSASFEGGPLRFRLSDGSVAEDTLCLVSSAPQVSKALFPALRVFQASPASFSAWAIGCDGELWSPTVLPSASGAPAGSAVVLGATGSRLTVDVSALAAPAGVYALSFALPGLSAPAVLSVLSSPAPLSFSPAVEAALATALLQGSAVELPLSLSDMASAQLPGWPLWLLPYDSAGLPARGVGAVGLACVSSASGACTLTLEAASAAAPGLYTLRMAAGPSSPENVSAPLSLQVGPNVSGLTVEGVTSSPGSSTSASALVSDASGRPVAGAQLSVSSLPDGVSATLSGVSSVSGLVLIDLQVGLTVPAGVYVYSVSLPSGATVPAQLVVSPLSVAVLASTPVPVGVGGTASVTLQVSLPSGAPASARTLQAVSPQDGLLADVVALTGDAGQALLSFSVADDFGPDLPSSPVIIELFSASVKVGEVPVQILPGLSSVTVFGAVAAGSSSTVEVTLTDGAGLAVAGREVLLSFPPASSMTVTSTLSPCPYDAGKVCSDGSGGLRIVVQASQGAVSELLTAVVDGVSRSVRVGAVR